MKTPTFNRTLAAAILALLLVVSHCAYGLSFAVTTTVDPDPINLCTRTTFTTSFNVTGAEISTPYVFYQQLPPGCTVSPCVPNPPDYQTIVDNITHVVTIEYTLFPSQADQVIDYCFYLTVPCNLGHSLPVTYPSGTFTVNGNEYTQTAFPLAGTTTTFQIVRPRMVFTNFVDDKGVTVDAVHECVKYQENGEIVKKEILPGQPIDYYPPPTPKYVISPTLHNRQYDLVVTDGRVESLVFNYSPAANICPPTLQTAFRFQGFHNGVAVPSGTVITKPYAANLFPYTFDQATVAMLFHASFGYQMVDGDSIRVIETFTICGCARADDPPTLYSIKWNHCTGTGCDDTATLERHTDVWPASGGISPGISFKHPGTQTNEPLDFCGAYASDIVVSFTNSSPNVSHTNPGFPCGSDGAPGSARKTLKTICFPFKQDCFAGSTVGGEFPAGSICVEGTGVTNAVPLSSFPTGFYTYGGQNGLPFHNPPIPPYHVCLDFTLLHNPIGQLADADGPLRKDLIASTGIYNQINDGVTISIRFKGAIFDCENARFYPDSTANPGFQWNDYPKPATGYMFFGDGDDRFDITYCDMCGGLVESPIDYGNFHYDFPVEITSQAKNTTQNQNPSRYGWMDMLPGDTATIDFSYCYKGGNPNASPFAFGPPNAPGQLYFDCKPVGYRVELRIPSAYALEEATYYVDHRYGPSEDGKGKGILLAANGTSDYTHDPALSNTFGGIQIIDGVEFRVYTFWVPQNIQTAAIEKTGHIEANVHLTNCPDPNSPQAHGGLDVFTAKVQAVCGNCNENDCLDTIAIISAALSKHCLGDCPPSDALHNTTSFTHARKTLGFEPGTTITVTPGENIEANNVYPCHLLAFDSTGTYTPTAPNPNAVMAFRLAYRPVPNPPDVVDFQFFEFESAGSTVTCTKVSNGNTYTYTINPLTDLANAYNATTGLGWNFAKDTSPDVAAEGLVCTLYVNFKDNTTANQAFLNAIKGGDELTLQAHIVVKIKPIRTVEGLLTFLPGNYPQLVKGQWWGAPDARPDHNKDGSSSCDPYWTPVHVLGVECLPYVNSVGSASDLVCGRAVEFGINFAGGLQGIQEFRNEEMPQCFWPATVTMTLSPALHLDPARPPTFTILDSGNGLDNGFPQPLPADKGFAALFTVAGNVVTFTGYSDGTNKPGPLPPAELTKDGRRRGLHTYVHLLNDCPDAQNISLNWPYVLNTFADVSCPTCRLPANPNPRTDTLPAVSPQPVMDMTFDAGQSVLYTNPGSFAGITLTYNPYDKAHPNAPKLPGSTLGGAWIKITPPLGVTVGSICVNPALNNTPITGVNGFFEVGMLPQGDDWAAHIVLKDVDFGTCVPGQSYCFTVAYGYFCGGPTLSDADALNSCIQPVPTYSFCVRLAESDLTMEVTPPVNTTGNACAPFQYTVHLSSTKYGTVNDPKVVVTLPAGMAVVDAQYQIVPNGLLTPFPSGTVTTNGNVVTLNVDKAAYNDMGMPGISYVDVVITVNGSCGLPGDKALLFSSAGLDLCGSHLDSVAPQETLKIEAGGNNRLPMIVPCPLVNLSCTDSTAPEATGYPFYFDACGQLKAGNSSIFPPPTDVIDGCRIFRTWSATICGTPITCTQILAFPSDTMIPVINKCPAKRVLTRNTLCKGIMPDMTSDVDAEDNCRVASIVQSIPKDTALDPGIYEVIITVTDECGNQKTCSTEVTVPSGITFSTTCPPNLRVPCDGTDSAVVSWTPPTAAEPQCCPGPVTRTSDHQPGDTFPIGVTPVTYTFTDACGTTTVCTFTVTVYGHGPGQWTWARRGSGSGADSGRAVAVAPQGNVFVTGSFTGAMDFPGSAVPPLAAKAGNTDRDIFVAMYNSNGIAQWAVRAGGPGDDAAGFNSNGGGVSVDAAGNAYVTGRFRGVATFDSYLKGTAFTMTSAGGDDIFIAKYNPGGECLWVRIAGLTGDDYGAGIAWTDKDGGKVFVTGGWGPGSGSSPGIQAFVLTVTAAGNFGPMTLSAPTALNDPAQGAKGRAIAVDNHGDPYVTGIYSGATTFCGTEDLPTGPGRMFVVKFDGATLGQCLATHAGHTLDTPASGSSDGFGIAVSTDPSGTDNYFCHVTGNFYGHGTVHGIANFGDDGTGKAVAVEDMKTTPANQDQIGDFLIAKLHFHALNTVRPVWVVNGGDSYTSSADLLSEDETRSLALDVEGNVYVTGFRHPNALNPFVNEGPTVLVAKFWGINGGLSWVRNATDEPAGTPEDLGWGIAVDGAGCVYVTGDFTEKLDFPPVNQPVASLTSAGARDMFVGKMCPPCACETAVVVNCPEESKTVECNKKGVGEVMSGYRILHHFADPQGITGDGELPLSELIEDKVSDGVFYGTTNLGGNGYGTVFRVEDDGSGYFVRHSFNQSGQGWSPVAGVTEGSDHILRGTTQAGGSGLGTVFRMEKSGNNYTRMHSFVTADGTAPLGRLVEGTNGDFYGTTQGGGIQNPGRGTVFQIARLPVNLVYAYTVLHSSADPAFAPDGQSLRAGLVSDGAGGLYGVASRGGTGPGQNGSGTVFRLNESGGGYQTMLSFPGFTGGNWPEAQLALGSDGAFYGTTSAGGTGSNGTVFRMTKNGVRTTLWRFTQNNTNDGKVPNGALCLASDGRFYGTTRLGGAYGNGTLFSFFYAGTSNIHYKVERDFGDPNTVSDGARPYAGVIQGRDGRLYGTTRQGGSGGRGTVFTLPVPCEDWPFDPPTVVDACCGGTGVTIRVVGTEEISGGCPKICKRTWEVTDCFPNHPPVLCSQTITAEDHTPPAVTTPVGSLNRNLDCSNADGLAAALLLAPEATDYCSIPTVSPIFDQSVPIVTPTNPGCANSYVRTRKWKFTDGCNNMSADFVQTITVQDNTGPEIMNVPLDIGPVDCANVPGQAPLPAVDACDGPLLIAVPNPDQWQMDVALNCFIRRTWTATDRCGNRTTAIQIIRLLNTTPPPGITCPTIAPITSCEKKVLVTYAPATVTATCIPIASVTYTCPSGPCPSPSLFPQGTTTVTCRATDACGHYSECTFNVIVNTPAGGCPKMKITSLGTQGKVEWDEPGSTLETTNDLNGLWISRPNEVSPFFFDLTNPLVPQQYFRLRLPSGP